MRTPAQRSAELAPKGALAPLREEALAAVVRWRAYRGGDNLHRPEPLLTELYGEQAARWSDDVDATTDGELPPDAVRVGFDAHGRPLIARAIGRFSGGGKHQLIRYGGEADELIHIRWTDDGARRVVVVHIRRDAAGRVVETRDDEETVVSYRRNADGRLEGSVERTARGSVIPYDCEYDADGELARIVRADLDRRIDWEAIRHRHEPELPPARELLDGAAPGLARALAAGIGAEAARLPEPVYALLWGGGLELGCTVVDRAHVVSLIRHHDDPLAPLHATGGGTGAREVDLALHADATTQRRLRQWAQRQELEAFAPSDPPEAPVTASRSLLDDLLQRLRDPHDGPGLPVVRSGDSAAGRELLRTLAPQLPPRPAPRAPLPARLPPAREALRELLEAQGLDGASAGVIADDAQIAIGLAPAAGGSAARSRIGGLPELPAGMAWPHRTPERPLTPLAAIDFAELPGAADRRELLPSDGTLLLFADVRDDENDELMHDWRTNGDGWFLALHVPAGAPVERVEPPRSLVERPSEEGPGLLPELAIVPRPLLTVRGGWSAAEQLGLDVGETVLFERIGQLAFESRDDVVAQLLGHPLPVQDDPCGPGEALVFSLGPGAALGFEITGVEGLYVTATEGDLRARRWERARLITDCG